MKKKLAPLLLVPIISILFMATPVPAASARSAVLVDMQVSCWSLGGTTTYSSLRFGGHLVSVECTGSYAWYNGNEGLVWISGPTPYYAEIKVGSHMYTYSGTFKPGVACISYWVGPWYDGAGWDLSDGC